MFLKMLYSALDRESESVFIDLLTFTDLEILKARKNNYNSKDGSSFPPSNTSSSSTSNAGLTKAQLKRYMILTYSSEFDKVHYPLPLNFEDVPNPISLLKVIKRLRADLNRANHHLEAVDGNGTTTNSTSALSLKKVVNQLRKDNEDLTQKILFYEMNQKNNMNGVDPNIVNAELNAASGKLRMQVEALRQELKDLSLAYEGLRNTSAKDILMLKHNLQQQQYGLASNRNISSSSSIGKNGLNSSMLSHGSQNSRGSVESLGNGSYRGTKGDSQLNSLRRQIVALERDLKIEKLNNSRLSNSNSATKQRGANGRNASPSYTNRSQISSGGSRRPSPSGGTYGNQPQRRPSPTQHLLSLQQQTAMGVASAYSGGTRRLTPSTTGGAGSNPYYRNPSPQPQRSVRPPAPSRSRSASPHVSSPARAWGAGPGTRTHSRDGESGYASTGSQSSVGSSRRSVHSHSLSTQPRRSPSPIPMTSKRSSDHHRQPKLQHSTHQSAAGNNSTSDIHSAQQQQRQRHSPSARSRKQSPRHATRGVEVEQSESESSLLASKRDVRIIRHIPLSDNNTNGNSYNNNSDNSSRARAAMFVPTHSAENLGHNQFPSSQSNNISKTEKWHQRSLARKSADDGDGDAAGGVDSSRALRQKEQQQQSKLGGAGSSSNHRDRAEVFQERLRDRETLLSIIDHQRQQQQQQQQHHRHPHHRGQGQYESKSNNNDVSRFASAEEEATAVTTGESAVSAGAALINPRGAPPTSEAAGVDADVDAAGVVKGNELSEIDKRIQSLQSYLNSTR